MKRITKMLVLALALVAVFSMGAGSTAEAKTKVTVKKVTAVDKATGTSVKSITLAKGGKATLSATVKVTPDKSSNKKVGYKSSKKSVASVDSKGNIKAKKAGKATITVYSKKNSKKKATVKVTVKSGISIKKVSLNKKSATLEGGKSLTLKATVNATPKKYKGTNKNVIWRSSNTKVATVKNGKVTAGKPAKDTSVTITVYSKYNRSKKATCRIKVKGQPAPKPTPTPTPQPKTTYTVLTPKNGEVNVKAVLKTADATTLKDIDAQLAKLAKAAVKKNDNIKIKINDQSYTAIYDGTNVTINGKTVSQSEQAKKYKAGDSIEVVFDVKTEKVSGLVALGASYVTSVTVDGKITLSEITNTTFKVNGKTTCTYKVNGKTIEITGDQRAVFSAIAGTDGCVTVSTTQK